MLDVKRMRMLREVAATGSFGAAAKALSFTPSAVSQQMAALERESGALLFERMPRGVRLTPAGEMLLSHAELALDRIAQAEADLAAIVRGHAGQLIFGSFPTATASFVAPAVRAFRAEHPDVDLHFIDGEPFESIVRLDRQQLDCAVLFDFDGWPATRAYDGQSVTDHARVEYQELFDDPFLVALPAEHPLAVCETILVEQLADERILGSPEHCAPWGVELERLCAEAGFQPCFEPRYTTVDFHAMQALVATGRGLSLLPKLSLSCVRDDIVMRRLHPAPVRHVKLGFPARAYRSAACDALVGVLENAAGDLKRGGGQARPPCLH